MVANFFGNEVAVPHAKAVVVDRDELVVRVVKEFNLVGNVHADRVTAEGFAGFNLSIQIR